MDARVECEGIFAPLRSWLRAVRTVFRAQSPFDAAYGSNGVVPGFPGRGAHDLFEAPAWYEQAETLNTASHQAEGETHVPIHDMSSR
jgi:hypothetical protein